MTFQIHVFPVPFRMQLELRHEEVFPIYGKGEAQFLPYMGKSARQGLAALTLYG